MDYENQQGDPWNVTGTGGGTPRQEPDFGEGRAYFSASDLGTISMAFGILAFFCYKGPFAILGLVLGIISQRKQKNDHATAGIVCSVINLAMLALGFIFIFALLAAAVPFFGRAVDYLKDMVYEW